MKNKFLKLGQAHFGPVHFESEVPMTNIPENPHKEIMVIPSFLHDDDITVLTNYIRNMPKNEFGRVEMVPEMTNPLQQMIAKIAIKHVNPYYNLEILACEEPDLVKFDGSFVHDNSVSEDFVKHFTIVVFLNDIGTDVTFSNQMTTIHPSVGTLIVYPSVFNCEIESAYGEQCAIITHAMVRL